MKNNMNSKKWIKILAVLCVLSFGFIGGINYLVDPFNIFHTKFLKEQFQMNERFMKIEYLEENKNKYNSYMFGSSRIGTTPPNVIDKYLENAKFYNFTISSANLYDYLIHLKYFIKSEYPIKNLYLQIDISNMASYSRTESDYLRKPHPFVVGEKLEKYYLSYLSGFFPFNIKGKIAENINQKDLVGYYLETGIWTRPLKEKKIKENPEKFIQEERSFNVQNKRVVKNTQSENNSKALKEIVDLCLKNNINLIIFTTPHNKNMMDTFILEDYLKFLKMISSIANFYDFTGYNTVTTENINYYESSHYRENVGRIIAARIFNDKSIEVPEDFGVFVTKDNIDEHLENLRKQIEEYDLKKTK
ncbi:hypothetical protein B0F89_1551 [Malaciobacter marinus]|uniref:DHHW protein n=1 Tax=Malaciobacter marinus TaxID=505249 RepID=A0AB36ZVF7_9BACT|nr:hypothetical protein [Malaciobacter marinus]PPK57115.1 hypothetical protein B0F89_1551 [Malaciobacter marinus]